MIDYIKIHGLAVNVEKLLNNERLTFPLSNIATTGEVLNRAQVAHYEKLQFVIKGENSALKEVCINTGRAVKTGRILI
jgi:hypothetical protein